MFWISFEYIAISFFCWKPGLQCDIEVSGSLGGGSSGRWVSHGSTVFRKDQCCSGTASLLRRPSGYLVHPLRCFLHTCHYCGDICHRPSLGLCRSQYHSLRSLAYELNLFLLSITPDQLFCFYYKK